jgi:hypothetical protein
LDRLIFGPATERRLSKRERRRLRLLQREEKERTDFLDYVEWLLKQPFRVGS